MERASPHQCQCLQQGFEEPLQEILVLLVLSVSAVIALIFIRHEL